MEQSVGDPLANAPPALGSHPFRGMATGHGGVFNPSTFAATMAAADAALPPPGRVGSLQQPARQISTLAPPLAMPVPGASGGGVPTPHATLLQQHAALSMQGKHCVPSADPSAMLPMADSAPQVLDALTVFRTLLPGPLVPCAML